MSVTADSASEAQASVPPRLELHCAVDPQGHADAVIPVRWCVGPELVKTLQERVVFKPYLLLIVRPFAWISQGARRRKHYYGESLRKLVPLTNELAYVSFSRPGFNEVRGVVVYNEEGGGARFELGPVFTAGDSFGYKVSIFDDYGDFYRSSFRRYMGKLRYTGVLLSHLTDSIDVEVPAEMFAKEYPEWVKAYVGKFFTSKPKDQCHMRKRTLFFAAPFSLVYFPIAYLVRIVSLIGGLVFGLRGLNPMSFIHPIKSGMLNVTASADSIKRSVWFKAKNGKRRPLAIMMLNPVSPLFVGVIFWLIGTIHVTRHERIVGLVGWTWWKYLVVAYLVQVALAAVCLLLLGLMAIVSMVIGSSLSKGVSTWSSTNWGRFASKRRENRKLAKLEHKAQALKDLDRELNAMVCRPSDAGVSLDALPKRKRTVQLRFQETKNKVCRPFAR